MVVIKEEEGRRKNICNVMRIKGRSRKFSTKDYSYIKPCKCKPSLPGWKGKDRIPGRGNHVCEHRGVKEQSNLGNDEKLSVRWGYGKRQDLIQRKWSDN